MKGSTVLKLIGVAAAMDFIDIVGKGEFLAWLKLEYPDAAKEWNSITGNLYTSCQLILKVSDTISMHPIQVYSVSPPVFSSTLPLYPSSFELGTSNSSL